MGSCARSAEWFRRGAEFPHRVQIQRHALVFDQTAPALQEPHKFIVIMKHALAHDRADHRIQSRAIAPPS